VPASLYDYFHFVDRKNREKMVMIPVMFDNPSDQPATLPAPRLSKVSQPQILLRAHNFLAYHCRNNFVEANTARLRQHLGSIQNQHEDPVVLPPLLGEGVVEQHRTNFGVLSSVFMPEQSASEMNIVNFLNMKHPYMQKQCQCFSHMDMVILTLMSELLK
jgi:hypothetical protein